MQLTINVHAGWMTVPAELARILEEARSLETAPGRTVGGDNDSESIRQFAEGLDDEPKQPPPQRTIAVRTYHEPTETPAPASSRFREAPAPTNGNGNGDAKPGKRFFGWLRDQGDDTLKRATRIGQRRGFPSRIVDWSKGMVDECRRELERSIATGNGYHRDN